ncbi:polysaccharide deacetylase family protein [Fusobacterium nucleatum]|uniref:polysaccharide deacetylase family protein n=1 Tax=Fusobacterium nucleatum TaxID=851 RepID=UPI00235E10B0|nr:polysaccharide deacetylase family protein [Fusobacterium nucleatum]WDD88408.1 polysaccharide deacetylase family protein [Fusobacterium nucleatum]
MNILMALSQLEITGAEVYATTIADELIERGNKVYIVSDTLTTPTKAEYIKLEFNKRSLLKRIEHIKFLYKFIKEKNIQIVHAHSRASSWSCQIACKLVGIPLITTTHGRQPIHFSRKLIKAFGDYSIAVCENIKKHMVNDIGFSENKISVILNPVNYKKLDLEKKVNDKKVISIVGRLSGPKGDVAYDLLEILSQDELLSKYKVRLIGGKELPERFLKFKEKYIEFIGYVPNIQEKIFESDIVIGAGRVAFEALLNKTSLIAVGETEYMGFINKENLDKSLASNFGDIGSMKYPKIEKGILLNDVEKALKLSENEKEELKNIILKETNLKNIVDKIEKKYFSLYVNKKKYDIPVIMYHRVINNPENEGVYGTYIYEDMFKKHLQYLKDKNYTVITFKDLDKIGWRNRFEKDKKYIFITFDDGYKDNYELAFPILKEFGFKATIFLMGSSTYNEWDVKAGGEKEFPLMSVEMIKEMQDYGIEFGAHTFNHPKLNTLSNEEIEHQIVDVKKPLEEKIGKEIITFAYPYGILNDYAKEMAKKAGYTFALATDSGSVCLSDDLYQIRRIAIFPNTNLFSFKRKIAGNYNFIKIKREERLRTKYE